MSRRKQAKPRSLKRDEDWDDGDGKNILDENKRDGEMPVIKPNVADEDDEEEEDDDDDNEDDEDEEEELQRAFSPRSEDYLQNGRSSSVQGPELENQNSLDSDALGTGSSSWHSEEGGPTVRRGGETPSSCATPTSASFPSEPEAEADGAVNPDGGNSSAPYPCQFCDRTFPRLSYLKKHEQSHGDQMPYRCSWCARLFKHKRSRDRHVKLHTGDRRYRCTHCEAAFSRSDHLKIHMKTHDTQKPYQCTACSRGYNTAAALTSHMQSHKRHHPYRHHHHHHQQQQQQQQHASQGTKLQEMEYGRRSVSSHSTSSPPVVSSPSPSLNLSINSKSSIMKNRTAANYSAPNTPVLGSPLKLACMYCTRDSFSCMQQLQVHVHTMHQAILTGERTAATTSPGGIVDQAFCPRDKIADLADVSGKELESRDDRKTQNEEKDRRDKTLSCGQCTMKFSSLSSLQSHLLSIHRTDGLGAALMMCPLCGIPCSSAAAYAEHYVLQHCENRRLGQPEAKEYTDPMAGLRLNGVYESNDSAMRKGKDTVGQEPADLTRKSLHSRQPENSGYTAGTLLCGQCGAALKDFESFREHLARHLQADHRNEPPGHACPKCEARFQEREDMLLHLTKHYMGQISKEYACGACKKMYPHPDLLQRHLLDSHAHHLYRCALCKDTFDSRVAIQVHFAVKHSQECRLYHCNACTSLNNENSPGNSPGEGTSFFRSETEMANHVRTAHAPPSIFTRSPATKSPETTLGIAGSTGPRCVFCGISCSSELELQLHLASHSASLYRCPICREGFAVEFLLDRHIAQMHHEGENRIARSSSRENGRIHRPSRPQDEGQSKSQKRGRSPASSNNNSLNQRDNNKRPSYSSGGGQQCELCNCSDFSNEVELQAHKKLVHSQSKTPAKSVSSLSLTCAYCGEVCRSRTELESHTRMQHASNESAGRHKCNICDEVCPSSGILAEHKLQKHCKIQLSDTCVVCRENLKSEAQFLEHVQRHCLENVDPQQKLDGSLPHLPAPCVVCRQTLITDLECRLHAGYHLRSPGNGQNSSTSPTPKQKIQNPNCCLCLRDCSSEDFVSLPSSHNGGGGTSLKVCKSCYIRHNQGLPILNSPYEHVKAGKCERPWPTTGQDSCRWSSPVDRWDYERKSSAEMDLNKRCGDCPVKFEDSDVERQRTLDNANGRANTYTCIQCQMSFPTEAKVQQHVKEAHLESTGRNSLECLRCHLCLFEANTPLQLQSHFIEHTFAGCAALSCYICQALFTVPIGLQNHMLQEHGLGARPYDCNNCTLKFFFRAELDHHLLTFHRSVNNPDAVNVKDTTERKNQGELDEESAKRNDFPVKQEIIEDGTEEDEEELNVDGQTEKETQAENLQKQSQAKAEIEAKSEDGINVETT